MKRIAWLDAKPIRYYKGIRIMADTGLHDQIAQLVQQVAPEAVHILDYGAGAGALSQRLHDLGYTVYSVDIDRDSFKATTPFEQIDFNNALAVQEFTDTHAEGFDLVLGIEVIEHIENPWQYVRNLKALVKPGGYIIISMPNITSWYSRSRFFFTGRFHQFEDRDRSYGHINPIAIDELELICHQTGLHLETVMPGGILPRIWLTRYPKRLLLNIFGFFSSFFMRGLWQGWGVIALIKKP